MHQGFKIILFLLAGLLHSGGVAEVLPCSSDNLESVSKNKFLDDFAKAPDDVIKNPELVNAWRILDDVGETGLSGRIDDIAKVDDYLKNNPTKTAQNVVDDIKSNGWQKWVDDINGVVKVVSKQIDDVLPSLKAKARYVLDGTGEYKTVKGHHPTAKKAFEGDAAYDYNEAFSVSTSQLDEVSGIRGIHSKITGQQNSLYSAWKQANPNKKLTIDVMADIEIKAMTNVGIPEDVATGWVVKALEDLKLQGVTEIKNIPWNGVN